MLVKPPKGWPSHCREDVAALRHQLLNTSRTAGHKATFPCNIPVLHFIRKLRISFDDGRNNESATSQPRLLFLIRSLAHAHLPRLIRDELTLVAKNQPMRSACPQSHDIQHEAWSLTKMYIIRNTARSTVRRCFEPVFWYGQSAR